nr:LysR substrate-binding domain-containing protein [Aeromonas hydrophila]
MGRTYYEHCKAMLVEAEAAQAAIEMTRAEPCGLIRMSCPIALLHTHVGPMLADFMARHPQIRVELEGTNRRVDPIAEGVDVAIRVRPPPLQDSELVIRILAQRRQCLVASPALVAQQGLPTAPADLHGWPSMGLGAPRQHYLWSLFGPQGAHADLTHQPRFVTTDMVALRSAALAGVGVVQLPLLMVQEQLTAATLVKVVPAWEPKPELIHAVFPSRRGLLPSVRALIDYLVERFAAIDEE